MATVTALFFDVGGVLLTNGWDRNTRRRSAERFQIDWDTMEERHELVVADFETGRLSLDEYLNRTVFHDPRPFSRDEFKSYMFAQSQPDPDAIATAAELAAARRYLMATLNNEARELNEYRLRHFRLRDSFTVFFSSCYLGLRKPDARIYRLALDLSLRTGDECVFVDDRPLNIDAARAAGLRAIRFESAAQLRRELASLGVL